MSFRAKLLLCVLLLVTVALDACLLMTVRQSTNLNLSRERARALGNHYELTQSASKQLQSLPGSANIQNTLPLVYNQLLRSQAGAEQIWYVGGELVLGDARIAVPPALLSADGLRRTAVSGQRLLAGSSLSAPHEHITLVSATSLLPLIEMNRQLSRQMLVMALVASSLLLGLAWLLLSGLLSPVTQLSKAMRRAMTGDFSVRVRDKGNGELSRLSQGFNRMAGTTQQHMAELSESAERSQRFSDNLAHEMRTPVTAIGGYARSLLEQPLEAADRDKALRYIATESARMQKMSEALLVLTGLRQDEIEMQPIRVPRLLEHVSLATAAELAAKNLRLIIDCALDAPDALHGDAALIESMLINLIVNSARASRDGQSIALRAGMDGGAPYLEVADRGSGMTRQQAAQATEAFYRTDKARSRSHGGVGLGLSLVRQICDAHGARLSIDSAPGQGTRVRIAFTTRLQPCEYIETSHPLN